MTIIKYIVYLQLMDFSSVAKLEGQQKTKEAPVCVGKGFPWMYKKMVRSPLYLERGTQSVAVLVMEKPKVRILPSVQGLRVYIRIYPKKNYSTLQRKKWKGKFV